MCSGTTLFTLVNLALYMCCGSQHDTPQRCAFVTPLHGPWCIERRCLSSRLRQHTQGYVLVRFRYVCRAHFPKLKPGAFLQLMAGLLTRAVARLLCGIVRSAHVTPPPPATAPSRGIPSQIDPLISLLYRGLAPRAVRTQQSELSTADKKQLLEKGATADRDGMDTERVSGLGAGP